MLSTILSTIRQRIRSRWFRLAMRDAHAARDRLQAEIRENCVSGVGMYRLGQLPGMPFYVIFEVGPREGRWRPVAKSFFYRTALEKIVALHEAYPAFSAHHFTREFVRAQWCELD